MLGRQLVAAIIGGLIVFIWGFLAWVVLDTTWHGSVIHPLPAETATYLKDTAKLKSGVYAFPKPAGYPNDSKPEEVTEAENRMKAGPIGMIVFRAEGAEPTDIKMLARGFGICMAGAFIAAVMAGYMAQAGCGFVGRYIAVLLLPVFAVVARDVMFWNFHYYPEDFTMNMAAETLGGWALAGIAIAMIVKPEVVKAAKAA